MTNYMKMALGLLIGSAIYAFGSWATAHEEPEQITQSIGGGMICDTTEQVVEFIESTQQRFPEGCGRLMGNRRATTTMLSDYVKDGRLYHMTQYEFEGAVPWGSPIQFGYFGLPEPTDKPDTKGSSI